MRQLPGSASRAWADAVRGEEGREGRIASSSSRQEKEEQEAELEDAAALELKQFDRMLLEKDKARRSSGGGTGAQRGLGKDSKQGGPPPERR